MDSRIKIIALSGILDINKGNEIRQQMNQVLADGADIVLVDMQAVTFINSSGLGALVSAMQIVRNANAKLYICSINNQVKMLFELTKMNKVFQIFANVDDFYNKIFAMK